MIGVWDVMNCRRRLISGIFCALLLAGFVRADMIPVYQPEIDRLPLQSVSDRAQVRQANQSGLFDRPLIDFDLGPIEKRINSYVPDPRYPDDAFVLVTVREGLLGGMERNGGIGACLQQAQRNLAARRAAQGRHTRACSPFRCHLGRIPRRHNQWRLNDIINERVRPDSGAG